MADVKISQLPAATTLAPADVLPLAQGTTTAKVSLTQLDSRWVSSSSGGTVNGGLTVNPYLAVGTNPAQTGVLRIPNNQFMYARNAANNADLPFLIVTSGNVTQVNASASVQITLNGSAIGTYTGALASLTTPLALGASPATVGMIRLPNNQYLYGRNAGNTADAPIVGINASNFAQVGNATTPVQIPGYLYFGTNAANTGAVRLPNNQHVYARNAGNTADVLAVGVSAIDQVLVGNNNAVGTGMNAGASGSHVFNINNVQQVGISDGQITFRDNYWLSVGSTVGLRIGTSGTQKLGFYGAAPVVRPTGWAAPTGTATRSTYATSTATVTQLAERLKALIDDLTALGLIGP